MRHEICPPPPTIGFDVAVRDPGRVARTVELLLTTQQSGFLNWLERQVDALQINRVDVDTLQAIIQRWQKLRAAAAQFDTGVADLIAVDY